VNKKLVYGESYTVKPTEKKEILKDLKERKSEVSRSKKLGVLLREEKTRSQELQRRVNRLEEENRRLRETLAKRSR
jgi:cell shape-determining protein MreC